MMIHAKLKSLLYLIFRHTYYKSVFGRISRYSRVYKPLAIQGGHHITIGKYVYIGRLNWLAAVSYTDSEAHLSIADGCHIGNFNHIYATHSITIEENVLTADKVYISDNLHSYEDIGTPVLRQPIKQLRPVTIGAGAWLGENVCVIGASVGRGSVVGANSVVTKDIPDYCVAVGAPARIIKRYDPATRQWEKVV